MSSKLTELRLQHGMSRYEVARQTGLTLTTITNIESGRVVPSSSTRRKIAELFGANPDWLFGVETKRCIVCKAEIPDRAKYFCSNKCRRIHEERRVQQRWEQRAQSLQSGYHAPPSLPLPMPRVGDRRMETLTISGAQPEEWPAQPCTVVQVEPMRGWYRVVFDRTGLSECYKVPITDPNSRRIK